MNDNRNKAVGINNNSNRSKTTKKGHASSPHSEHMCATIGIRLYSAIHSFEFKFNVLFSTTHTLIGCSVCLFLNRRFIGLATSVCFGLPFGTIFQCDAVHTRVFLSPLPFTHPSWCRHGSAWQQQQQRQHQPGPLHAHAFAHRRRRRLLSLVARCTPIFFFLFTFSLFSRLFLGPKYTEGLCVHACVHVFASRMIWFASCPRRLLTLHSYFEGVTRVHSELNGPVLSCF